LTVIYNAERASVPLSARKFEAFTVIVENRVLRGREEASRLAHNQEIGGSIPPHRNQIANVLDIAKPRALYEL